ncbi:amino acid ABC transporter substrate-binding protein [Ornithinimicrobium tianjinense]|uniref:Amino acid ABC transporter substrate-binding protein n=1 Tax=Ornithinimicrobium tianjinense TaxID=1195761 RepID=A0A917F7I0_9MICO|nr:amino acid ABC transporter substrate-binding protein [Ornithinimicrobium tianjinense]GGF54648.1 amino acid ABC transporter substrate-binding protein [Ornithinimicrobium tianjinense]
MTRTRSLAVSSLALATALTLAACGSGSGSGSASGDDTASGSAAAGADYGLLEDGVLTVGTEGTYKPFSYHEGAGGDLTGYDVEVVEAVADKLGLEVEYQETQWDAMFAGLDAGRFDVIANQVSINPEREAKYLFSTPYTVSTGVVVVAEDNTDITSVADLEGKTSAQSLTSNWKDVAEGAGATVEAIEGWAQAVTLVEQGRVDATVNDELTFLDYLKTNPDAPIKVAAETEDSSSSALTFTQDKAALVAAVDEALAELAADGTLAELGEKYFGADVSQ